MKKLMKHTKSNVVHFSPQVAPRSVTILGSTGTIGQNTLKVIADQPHHFKINALTAGQNAELLIKQALRFQPEHVVIEGSDKFFRVKDALKDTPVEVHCGAEALDEAAATEVDIVISGIVGAAALRPTLAAIQAGNTIGLANKECLVCAGELMIDEAIAHNAILIPVDSEHNAIYQATDYETDDAIEAIYLTASGGPFRTLSLEEMKHVTPEQAVAHPNWDMGAKISVDSATMMNKGLELIEAYHLFGVEAARLKTVVHPESIIHGMVYYADGAVVAGLSEPDMCVPIAYALGWPERLNTKTKRLNLLEIGALTFEKPDEVRFPALRLARECLEYADSAPCIFNVANEVAVDAFLNNRITYLDIARIVEETLQLSNFAAIESIEHVYETERRTRELTSRLIDQQKRERAIANTSVATSDP